VVVLVRAKGVIPDFSLLHRPRKRVEINRQSGHLEMEGKKEGRKRYLPPRLELMQRLSFALPSHRI
jgi:hypothetical protein